MNNVEHWYGAVRATLGDNTWIVQVFVVVLATALLDLAQRRALARLARRAERTRTLWDDALLHALVAPLSVVVWVLGVTFAAELVAARTDSPLFELVAPLRYLGIVVALTWFLIRLVAGVEKNLLARAEQRGEDLDRTTVDAVGKLVRASVVITGALVALQTLGFSISGVLAFGGIGGLAVGLAARDLLANFFGGLTVYLDRPFVVGNWILSPDRSIEGVVERIGWRVTAIRTFDKRPIYVPNATFTTIAVENPSRMTHRRIYETIGVRYQDISLMRAIVSDVESMLANHDAIDTSQTLMVHFNAFNASSVDFFIYCFTHTVKWQEYHAVKEDVLLRISDIIAGHGAEIAFPTSTLHFGEPLELQGLAQVEPRAVQAPSRSPGGS